MRFIFVCLRQTDASKKRQTVYQAVPKKQQVYVAKNACDPISYFQVAYTKH